MAPSASCRSEPWMCLNQTAHTSQGVREGASTLGRNGLGDLLKSLLIPRVYLRSQVNPSSHLLSIFHKEIQADFPYGTCRRDGTLYRSRHTSSIPHQTCPAPRFPSSCAASGRLPLLNAPSNAPSPFHWVKPCSFALKPVCPIQMHYGQLTEPALLSRWFRDRLLFLRSGLWSLSPQPK